MAFSKSSSSALTGSPGARGLLQQVAAQYGLGAVDQQFQNLAGDACDGIDRGRIGFLRLQGGNLEGCDRFCLIDQLLEAFWS